MKSILTYLQQMNEPITREEMQAAMRVQSKNTEQMLAVVQNLEKIIDNQTHLTKLQEKVVEKMTNGIKNEIAHEVVTEMSIQNEACLNITRRTMSMLEDRTPVIRKIANDIDKVKWFIGVVGIVIIIASVILRGMEANNVLRHFEKSTIEHNNIVYESIQKHLEGEKE